MRVLIYMYIYIFFGGGGRLHQARMLHERPELLPRPVLPVAIRVVAQTMDVPARGDLAPRGSDSPPPGTRMCSSLTHTQHKTLSSMLQDHAAGADVCLVGGCGMGKTTVVREFAKAVGAAQVRTMFCYRDMSARDFTLRRSTTVLGDTTWQMSPLIQVRYAHKYSV